MHSEAASQMHPLSPRAVAMPRTSPRPALDSHSVSGVTTASTDGGASAKAAPDHDEGSSGTGPITPDQMTPVVPSEASIDYNRLKEENSSLAQQ